MALVLLLMVKGGRLVDTACSRRCHASIKSRQTSPTGDERQNKSKSGPSRPTASKRVSSPPGRDHLLHVGRHRQPKSKQQASMQHSPSRLIESSCCPASCEAVSGYELSV